MKKRRKKKLQHWFEVAFLKSFMFWFWIPPLHTIYQLADCIGWFAFAVLRIRRHVVMCNLAQAFPEKSLRERKRIALCCYQNFAKTAFEFMRFPVTKRETILSRCQVQGLEDLDSVLKKGKGALLVSGHFGNWELIGPVPSHFRYSVSLLVGTQHNSNADEIINKHRMTMGAYIIRLGMNMRNLIRVLRKNQFVVILSDQNAGKQGIFIDFFGKKASTAPGVAAITLKTGAPIVYFFMIRQPKGRYKVIFQHLNFEHLKESSPENQFAITQAYSRLLENTIRKYPDQYFWMHKRWRSRSQDDPVKIYG